MVIGQIICARQWGLVKSFVLGNGDCGHLNSDRGTFQLNLVSLDHHSVCSSVDSPRHCQSAVQCIHYRGSFCKLCLSLALCCFYPPLSNLYEVCVFGG